MQPIKIKRLRHKRNDNMTFGTKNQRYEPTTQENMSHHVQFTPVSLICHNRKFLATSFELRETWGNAVF